MLRRPQILPELRLRASILRRQLSGKRRGNRPLWSDVAEFDESWKTRIAFMANFIDRPGLVADFGCGQKWLEQFLPAGSTYLPIDYIRRDERTLVLDLNNDRLPNLGAPVAFMSGVLEYVRDVGALIEQLEQQEFTRLIVSYNTLDRIPRIPVREAVNWVSHLHLDELLMLFCHGFDLVQIDLIIGNTILVLDRKPRPANAARL